MINLIPPEGHKIISREYIYRLTGTFAFLFGVIFLILTVGLFPTYILIDAQINTFTSEIKKESEKTDTANKLDEEIKLANNLVSQLKSATATIAVSTAIIEIQSIATDGIVFKAFTFEEPNAKGIITIRAQGFAPTREALARLKVRIEASDMFEKAEIPLSDLARDVEVPFVMTITLPANPKTS